MASKKLANGETALKALCDLRELGAQIHVRKKRIFIVHMTVETIGQRTALEEASVLPCESRHRHLSTAIYNLLRKLEKRVANV